MPNGDRDAQIVYIRTCSLWTKMLLFSFSAITNFNVELYRQFYTFNKIVLRKIFSKLIHIRAIVYNNSTYFVKIADLIVLYTLSINTQTHTHV